MGGVKIFVAGIMGCAQYMFMRTPTRNRKPQGRDEASSGVDLPVHDFNRLSESQDQIVEHRTIPGFLGRIPHRWHMDEVTRFGDKVGRAAESMQLAYLTVVDRSLGVIRVFPVPLMERIYTLLAPQFAWPELPGGTVDNLPTPPKRLERLLKGLEELTEDADDLEILESLQKLRDFVRRDLVASGTVTPPATVAAT